MIPHSHDVYQPWDYLEEELHEILELIEEKIKEYPIPLNIESFPVIEVEVVEHFNKVQLLWLDWYAKQRGWGSLTSYIKTLNADSEEFFNTVLVLSPFEQRERGYDGPMGIPGAPGEPGKTSGWVSGAIITLCGIELLRLFHHIFWMTHT